MITLMVTRFNLDSALISFAAAWVTPAHGRRAVLLFGGALPLPPLKNASSERLVDTCVYHQPGIDLLTRVIPVDNILFASEMIGAVRDIDPATRDYYDETKRYIEALSILSAAGKRKSYERKARRVFPRLDAVRKSDGR